MLWFWRLQNFRTCWSGCRVQVWVQVWAPAGHQAILVACWKTFSSSKSIVVCSDCCRDSETPCVCACPSYQPKQSCPKSLAVDFSVTAFDYLLEQPSELFRYCLSLRVKKVLLLCKLWAATSHFFSCEMKFSTELESTCFLSLTCLPKNMLP